MSEHRRPAARFAAAINLPELTLFIHTRALVLATDAHEIADLEHASGITQEDALRYFVHVYQWEPEIKAALDTPTDAGDEKRNIVRGLLKQTLGHPLFVPLPEA